MPGQRSRPMSQGQQKPGPKLASVWLAGHYCPHSMARQTVLLHCAVLSLSLQALSIVPKEVPFAV
jgi:hypothetical protein